MTHFRFETGAVIDAEATAKAGRHVYKEAVMCRFAKPGGDIVMNADSKAFQETYMTVRPNSDKDKVAEVSVFRAAYDAFKSGKNTAVQGTPIGMCPFLAPHEVQNLRAVGIESLEQLAEVKDEELKDKGIPKALRDKAEEYLRAAKDVGISVNENQRLREENEYLKLEVHELTDKVKNLEAQIAALNPDPKDAGFNPDGGKTPRKRNDDAKASEK